MKYDVIIVGAGPGGIFAAYELAKKAENMKIAVFEAGHSLENRRCPIDGDKVKSCIKCKSCSIMNGFGGGWGEDFYQLTSYDVHLLFSFCNCFIGNNFLIYKHLWAGFLQYLLMSVY